VEVGLNGGKAAGQLPQEFAFRRAVRLDCRLGAEEFVRIEQHRR